MVAEYSYTAFGECFIITNVNNIANLNPFRYRGYIYEEISGLYYLKSRFYNPVTGRFISPDDTKYLQPDVINGLNLFAYCSNNPIMRFDPNGNSWKDFWNGVKNFGNTIKNGFKSVVGEVVSFVNNVSSNVYDCILFGYETSYDVLFNIGNEKGFNFIFEANGWKFWNWKVGFIINTDKFDIGLTASMSEYALTMGNNGNYYEVVAGIKRLGLGFSKESNGNRVSGQFFVRTIPLVLGYYYMPILSTLGAFLSYSIT